MSNTVNSVTSLKSLLSSTKIVEADYPGNPGFKVNLSFLSREELVKIRKKATSTSFKKGAPVETLDDNLFLSLYAKSAIKGWSGLTLAILETLAPVDISGEKPDAVLEYNEENALFLMKQSTDFDSFVSETVTDLANFPSASGKK
jgi:hypothetical protein